MTSKEAAHNRGRWLSLFAAWLAMLMTGSSFSFNIYTNAVKETFNYTQTEVNYLVTMLTTGLDNGLLPGILSRYTGPQGLAAMALILTSSGYFLTWSAFSAKEFYSRHSNLLTLYFAMSGFGTSFIFLATLIVSIENFSPKHRGKSVGLVETTMAGISPAALAGLYACAFSNNQYQHPERQRVRDFMLFLAVGFVVAYSFSVLFLKVYPYQEPEVTACLLAEKKVKDTDPAPGKDDIAQVNGLKAHDQANDVRGTDLPLKPSQNKCSKVGHFIWNATAYLFTVEMQCMMWSFAILASVNSVFYHNNAIILVSSGNNNYIPVTTILLPICAILSSLVISVVSDYYIEQCPRLVYVLVFSAMQTLNQLLLVFLSDSIYMLVFATILTGCSNGLVWNLMVTVVSEVMGVLDFGRNWGTVTLCYAILNIFIQYAFGSFYDLNADADHNCSGTACFRGTFSICAVLCFLSTIFILSLLLKHQKRPVLARKN